MPRRAPVAPSLAARLRAKLAASGLTPADAKKLGYEPVTAGEAARRLGRDDARAGFVLPYYDLDGRRVDGLFRIRYLEDAVGTRRAPKYDQPAGAAPRAYLPPLTDWRAVAADPARRVLITEGELKAAAATKAGFPTIGLGGVWNFRSAAAGFSFLPELEAFAWRERPVFVAYDADVRAKPEVRAALEALSRVLTDRGAAPAEVALPELPDRPKTGLDDYLVATGAAELEARLAAAKPFVDAVELWQLNREFAVVLDPPVVVNLATGQQLGLRAFTELYQHRRYTRTTQSASGRLRVEEVALPPAWLSWPNRRQHSRLVYSPGEPAVTERNELNLWRGWPLEPRRGDVRPWLDYLAYLFHDLDPDHLRWVEAWLAYPIRYPGTKLHTALFVWSAREGVGKSYLGKILSRVYGDGYNEVGPEVLEGSFNAWAVNKQFVMIDEAKGEHRRADSTRLRKLITEELIEINKKYVPQYTVRNRINYYLNSNHADAIEFSPDDRRFFIHEFDASKRPPEYFDRLDRWLDDEGGAAALFHHLLYDVDTTGFQPYGSAPLTEAKRFAAELGASPLDAWVGRLAADPDAVLAELGFAPEVALLPVATLWDHVGPDDRGRYASKVGLGRALTRAGFPRRRVRTAAGLARLYALRDRDAWRKRSHADWAAAYAATVGRTGGLPAATTAAGGRADPAARRST